MSIVHVYRNRSDDTRTSDQLHFCTACRGYYGVPHDTSHCQHPNGACACRPCREFAGLPIEGAYGYLMEVAQ